MIFGEIKSAKDYYELYPELLKLVRIHFNNVQAGVQGDALIWIEDGDEKVSLDTFSSMQFQIKADKSGGNLLENVLSTINQKYQLVIYTEPELEAHED